jgi:ketosteroid isomerase-like protein
MENHTQGRIPSHHRNTGLMVLVFILTLGVSSCTQSQPDTPSFSAQDVAAIRANLDTFMIGDPIDEPETFFSQFTEDVYWVFGNLEQVGMESLKSVNWCHALVGEITADRVEGSGNLAYARGTYRLSLDCGGDTPIDSEGVFLSAHRRQQDGTWRIESMILHDNRTEPGA